MASKIVFRKTLPSRSRCRWVVANLTAPVLLELAESWLIGSVAPGGKLILSGILASEWADVFAPISRAQLTLLKKIQKGEWITLLLEKREK
ncbi:MAG: 50S ribosomal protein L11 methyltransferase [Candidatus Manganitrophus sp.]|nr:50S ribosomal protein L11 methyltransferase [Candidatus Manganitrophus sp.]